MKPPKKCPVCGFGNFDDGKEGYVCYTCGKVIDSEHKKRVAELNKITTWAPGSYVPDGVYDNSYLHTIQKAREAEALKVRPSPKGHPICVCESSADAAWIAERLNLAVKISAKATDAVQNEKWEGYYNEQLRN